MAMNSGEFAKDVATARNMLGPGARAVVRVGDTLFSIKDVKTISSRSVRLLVIEADNAWTSTAMYRKGQKR